ncbi:MAG TPA: sulfurtransferase TusA family protein [Conexivisphaerales archaeon]|nr:sulfurtransferase TusA family protein [Conexivisphaerales archaeon]
MAEKPAKTIDVRGLACPIPVFEVNKNIGTVNVGETIEVLATDPAAVPDIKAWAERRGHLFLGAEPRGGYSRILVKRTK